MVALIKRMLFLENYEDNQTSSRTSDYPRPEDTHLNVLGDPEIPGCSNGGDCASDDQSVGSWPRNN